MSKNSSIQIGSEVSGGGELRVCRDCSKPFVFYRHPVNHPESAKRCPTCTDKRQGRPTIVQERTCLNMWEPVVIRSLPGEWKEFQSDVRGKSDLPTYKIDVCGKEYGASWTGRIVMYCREKVAPGRIVQVREMEVVHLVKKVTTTHMTLEHGEVAVSRNIPIMEDGLENDAEVQEVQDRYRYIVLEPVNATKALMSLTWTTRYSKTTLKGFGRQYQYFFSKDMALATWAIHGGVRSGRAYTEGVLSLTDPEHPVTVTGSLEVEGQEEVIG